MLESINQLKTEKNMVINFRAVQVHPRTCIVDSYSSTAKKAELVEDLLSTYKVTFFIQPKTKTTLSLEVSTRTEERFTNMGVAYVPKGSEKFKFLERDESSYFSVNPNIKHYFKITKKQGYDELLEHISNVLWDLVGEKVIADKSIDCELRFFQTEGMVVFPNNVFVFKEDKNGKSL